MVMFRLKEICKEKGITLSEVSEKLGISQPSVSGFATGKIKPSYDTILALSDFLGVPVGELFEAPKKANVKNVICPHCGQVVFQLSDVGADS